MPGRPTPKQTTSNYLKQSKHEKISLIYLAGLIATVAAAGLILAYNAKAADESKTDSETKSKLSVTDKKFVKKAYKGGLTEVEDGKMAKEKARTTRPRRWRIGW